MSSEDRSDKFVYSPEDVVLSQCAYCSRLSRLDLVCAAFPGSIPPEILANTFDHSRPWIDPETGEPGDRGIPLEGSILFDPKPGVTPAQLARLRAEIARAASDD